MSVAPDELANSMAAAIGEESGLWPAGVGVVADAEAAEARVAAGVTVGVSTTLNALTSSRMRSTVRSLRWKTLVLSSSDVRPLSLARIPHQRFRPNSFLSSSLDGRSPPIRVFSLRRTSPDRTELSIVCHSSRSLPSGLLINSWAVSGVRWFGTRVPVLPPPGGRGPG